jgi:hypothetical protein
VNRDDVLREAGSLISGDRHVDYGDAWENHKRIADIWSVIFRTNVTPSQVALAMAGVKIARLVNDPTKMDSWVDIAGYAALGAEMEDAEWEEAE